jgi:hypothetical protein
MQQFIPFEDDWDALANLRPEDMVPYRVGMLKDSRVSAVAVFPTNGQTPVCERAVTPPPSGSD